MVCAFPAGGGDQIPALTVESCLGCIHVKRKVKELLIWYFWFKEKTYKTFFFLKPSSSRVFEMVLDQRLVSGLLLFPGVFHSPASLRTFSFPTGWV